MKTIPAIVVLLSTVAVAQSQPDLASTVDFMDKMVQSDERRVLPVPDSKCELMLLSWHRVESFVLFISSKKWMISNDSDVPESEGAAIEFPRYVKFNLADVDPSTVLSSPGFFSSKYVKRFWDEHASVCKVVGYECERQQMLAFDQNRTDLTSVSFKTVDLKPVIERGGLSKATTPAGTTYTYVPNVSVDKMLLSFTDQDKAQRFVTALVHAAHLCGGNGGTFAPTPEAK